MRASSRPLGPRSSSRKSLDSEEGAATGSATPREDNLCWMCREVISSDPDAPPASRGMPNVCHCQGVNGNVHQACIEKWVFDRKESSCPLCNHEFGVDNKYIAGAPPFTGTRADSLYYAFHGLLVPFCVAAGRLVLVLLARGIAMPVLCGGYALRSTDSELWEDYLCGFFITFGIVAQFRKHYAAFQRFCSGEMKEGATTAGDLKYTQRYPVLNALNKVEKFVDMSDVSTWDCLRRWGAEFVLALAGVTVVQWVGLRAVLAAYIVASIYFRLSRPRVKTRNPVDKLAEALAARTTASQAVRDMWFQVFMLDVFVFTYMLVMCAGYTAHYAAAPYLGHGPEWPTTFREVAGHWALGTLFLLLLIRTEGNFVSVLFAPGVDLFVVRAVTPEHYETTTEFDGWSLILAQVYEADWFRVIFDFLRASVTECTALFLFVRGSFALLASLTPTAFPMGAFPRHPDDDSIRWLHTVVYAFFMVSLASCLDFSSFVRKCVGLMVPIVQTVGHALSLTHVLFDEEQQRTVDVWTRSLEHYELFLPPVPMKNLLVKRRHFIPKDKLPKFFTIRMLLFSAVYHTVCAAFVFLLVALGGYPVLQAVHQAGLAPDLLQLLAGGSFLVAVSITSVRDVFSAVGEMLMITGALICVAVVMGAVEVLRALLNLFSITELGEDGYELLYLESRVIVPMDWLDELETRLADQEEHIVAQFAANIAQDGPNQQ